MNAIIVDDEEDARNLLNNFLDQYCPEVRIIDSFESSLNALDFLTANSNDIDLIYLDISMPNLNGIDFLRKIQHLGCNVVFVTAYNQYAIQAIRLAALDYILKPIDIDALINATNRAITQKNEQESITKRLEGFVQNEQLTNYDKTILLNTGNELIAQRIGDISYLEADGNYTYIHGTNGKKLIITRQLGKYVDILDSFIFFRVHRSFIVNIDQVSMINRQNNVVHMKGGFEVPVSLRRKKSLIERLDSVN